MLATILVISISGCKKDNVQYIGNFVALNDANNAAIQSRFSLYDGSKNYISADGNIQFRMVNSEEETVYAGSIDVKKNKFALYTTFLGQKILAYAWETPVSKIKKSLQCNGTMYLKYRTKSGVEFEEMTTSVILPVYTKEELIESYEKEFIKSAITVNKKLSKGIFEVTVVRVGFFTLRWDNKEHFRIDMEIKNIGSNEDYYWPCDLTILDNKGNQYDVEHLWSSLRDQGGTLGSIYPGVTKNGYILFNIPKTSISQDLKLVFKLGSHVWTFNISLL